MVDIRKSLCLCEWLVLKVVTTKEHKIALHIDEKAQSGWPCVQYGSIVVINTNAITAMQKFMTLLLWGLVVLQKLSMIRERHDMPTSKKFPLESMFSAKKNA